MILIKILVFIIAVVFCVWRGGYLSYEVHKEIYGIILNVSGILFGVFGVWIGILYPGILEHAEKIQQQGESKKISQRANNLLKPLFISLIMLLFVFSILFFAPIIKSFCLSSVWVICLKSVSLTMAGIIFYILFFSIISAISDVESFKSLITKTAIINEIKNTFYIKGKDKE